MDDPVRRQRTILCDLLESLSDEQWAAETMCAGWDAGDVAAHLLVREREPLAAAGLLLRPIAGFTAKRTAARKERGRAALIAQLRAGPTKMMTIGPLGKVQVSEDYIHTEDIRRGGATTASGTAADLTPDDGTGDAATDELLWEAIGRFAMVAFAGVRVDGVVAMTDGGRTRAYKVGGRLPRPASDGPADVTISAPAGELLLFVTGRVGADVTLQGDDALIAALQAAKRGI